MAKGCHADRGGVGRLWGNAPLGDTHDASQCLARGVMDGDRVDCKGSV